MRLNFKAILIATVTAIMAASCVEGTLELRRPGLEDVDATKVELTKLVSSDAARVRPFYVYELTLASADESVVLDAKFVSDVMQLDPATFTAADMANAHRNTFVIGNDGSTLTVGGVECPVLSGNLKVTAESGAYTVSGLIAVSVPAEEGKSTNAYYELAWAGDAVAVKFPELPTQQMFTQLLSAESNLINERNTVTVKLATDGVAADGTGTGEYLVAEFYSADGYLAAGTYTPSKNPNNPKPGEYVIGYDGDFYNVGVDVENVGTCWWTVKDGVATAEKITAGNLYVAFDKKSKEFTIDIDNGVQFHRFVGEIAALTPGNNGNVEQDEVLNADVVIEKSVPTLIKADDTAANTTADGAALSGVTLYYVELQDASGEKVAIFDLVTEKDSPSLAGEYKITSYPDEVGEAGNGFDLNFPDWGLVMSGGTILYDGGNTYVLDADTGTITVQEKDGAYKIVVKGTYSTYDAAGTATTKTIAARYIVGEWKNEGDGGEDIDYTIVPSFLGLTPGDGIVTVYLGEEGMKFENNGVTGVGNYFKFDAFSADGTTLAPGTYTASAEGGKVTEGTFGIGWDPGDIWGIGWEFTNWGTCYMTRAEDNSETGIKIEDGTMEIEEDGGNYVIKVKSSAMNIKYEGPLQ